MQNARSKIAKRKPPQAPRHDLSQALEEEGRLAELDSIEDDIGVTGRIRVALEALVYEGKRDREAAEIAGLSLKSLRAMLSQTKYATARNRMLQVRRENEKARNIQVAAEIRDAGRNETARIAALRFLHGEGEGSRTNVTVNVTTPGYVIRARHDRVIEHQSEDEDK